MDLELADIATSSIVYLVSAYASFVAAMITIIAFIYNLLRNRGERIRKNIGLAAAWIAGLLTLNSVAYVFLRQDAPGIRDAIYISANTYMFASMLVFFASAALIWAEACTYFQYRMFYVACGGTFLYSLILMGFLKTYFRMAEGPYLLIVLLSSFLFLERLLFRSTDSPTLKPLRAARTHLLRTSGLESSDAEASGATESSAAGDDISNWIESDSEAIDRRLTGNTSIKHGLSFFMFGLTLTVLLLLFQATCGGR